MIDAATFRRMLGHYPTGVCVITSVRRDGGPIGMSIGSFTSVSLDPPLVAFFPGRHSTTWARIRDTGRFCVNVLGDHQADVSRRFGAPLPDKFDGIGFRRSDFGLPIINGVMAWIDCRVHSVHEAGDHFIAVGQVASLETARAARPLVFHKGGYGQVSALTVAA